MAGRGLEPVAPGQGAVRPECVVVEQVFGQYPAQVMLIDDQQPVEDLTAQNADHPFADGVRSGRLRWAGDNPDAVRGEYDVPGSRRADQTSTNGQHEGSQLIQDAVGQRP